MAAAPPSWLKPACHFSSRPQAVARLCPAGLTDPMLPSLCQTGSRALQPLEGHFCLLHLGPGAETS